MKVYLVGGAVRDQLLNFPYKDRDYVVVGATVEQMLAEGFKPVGKDFPVFIHPERKDEYALARTERKSGIGYKGFEIYASPDVTLEEDLRRRDLTINAMAQSDTGLVDPYGGVRDLEKKILRHVSPSFKEDPLRILRVARFAARYAHLGFIVASDTLSLMQEMVNGGELASLVKERVWQETSRALGERSPEAFFDILRQCGALAIVFPEIDALYGVPQPPSYHPEIDTGVHTMMVLQQASRLSQSPIVRFAALVHDLGKALTPPDDWPRHHDHEKKGLEALKDLVNRLRVPNEYADLASKVIKFHTHCHRSMELKPSSIIALFESLGCFRQHKILDDFILACEADSRGRTGFENKDYPQASWLKRAFATANSVNANEFVDQGLTGKTIAEAMRNKRIKAVDSLKKELDCGST